MKIFTNIPNNRQVPTVPGTVAALLQQLIPWSRTRNYSKRPHYFSPRLNKIINRQMIQACDHIFGHRHAQFFTVVTCLRSIWMTSGEMFAACWLSCSIFAAVSCSRRLTFAPESPLLCKQQGRSDQFGLIILGFKKKQDVCIPLQPSSETRSPSAYGIHLFPSEPPL